LSFLRLSCVLKEDRDSKTGKNLIFLEKHFVVGM